MSKHRFISLPRYFCCFIKPVICAYANTDKHLFIVRTRLNIIFFFSFLSTSVLETEKKKKNPSSCSSQQNKIELTNMAANYNPAPTTLQPRRYSGQKRDFHTRGNVDPPPRTSFYKRAYAHGARNEVSEKNNSIENIIFIILGNEHSRTISSCV